MKINADFLKLWGAQAISLVGDQIYLLALPWFVYDLTKSGVQMSVVFAFETMPCILFGVLGGSLSDYWGRKYSLILGHILASLPLIFIYTFWKLGMLKIWHIYITAIVLSSIIAIINPTFEASITSIVPDEDLVKANSIMESTNSFAAILGPIFASFIIAKVQAVSATLLDAASFILAAFVLLTIKIPQQKVNSTGERTSQIIRELLVTGITYVPRHRILRWGVLMSTLSNVILGAYDVLLIFYMRDKLKFNAETIGLLLTVASSSSILVSALLAPRLPKRSKGTIMVFGLFLQGLGVLFVGLSSQFSFLVLAQSLYTSALTLYAINWRSLRQSIVPNHLVGRVAGVSRGIAYAGASVGSMLGAATLHWTSTSTTFLLEGAMVLFVAVASMFSPMFRSSEDSPRPLAPNSEKSE